MISYELHKLQALSVKYRNGVSRNTDSMFINEVAKLCKSEIAIIYVSGIIKGNIITRFRMEYDMFECIRISKKTIPGYSALNRKILNINDVYDEKELASIDPEIKYDNKWDIKMGFTSKQLLSMPIIMNNKVFGVLELINTKNRKPFSIENERYIFDKIFPILEYALLFEKFSTVSPDRKFAKLIEKGILDENLLQKYIIEFERQRIPIEEIIAQNTKIKKNDLIESLSHFYDVRYVLFDENQQIPYDLVTEKCIKSMKDLSWVPLCINNNVLIVATDNPCDFNKISGIKSIFPYFKLELRIALKDDIVAFINLITRKKYNSDVAES